MGKVVIEFSCNGDAAIYFDQLIEDSRDLFKNSETALADYESISYEFRCSEYKGEYKDPALNCECGYQH